MKTDSQLWREIAERVDSETATNLGMLIDYECFTDKDYARWKRLVGQLSLMHPGDSILTLWFPWDRQSRVIACLLLSEITKEK